MRPTAPAVPLVNISGRRKGQGEDGDLCEAAKLRGEASDHVFGISMGPPGLGKTTLAHIVAGAERQYPYHFRPAIERPGRPAALLTNLRIRTFFIR